MASSTGELILISHPKSLWWKSDFFFLFQIPKLMNYLVAIVSAFLVWNGFLGLWKVLQSLSIDVRLDGLFSGYCFLAQIAGFIGRRRRRTGTNVDLQSPLY